MKYPTLYLLAGALPALATPLTSTDYTISSDTLDYGGQLVTSTDYSMQGSMGPIGGTSSGSSAGAAILAHSGFIGEIYELLGYGLLASDSYPPEEGSTQIIPVRTADDGTNVVIPTTGFNFVPLEGPIPEISGTGLVATATVYENTQAIVGATSDLFSGILTLVLNVQDTNPDNYSTYAADGLPDAWQREYFGIDNPLAAPLQDPDDDGQDNHFEYTAGVVPTDSLSNFHFSIQDVAGESNHKELIFSPALPDRTYTVKSNTSLNDGIWELLGSEADDHQEPERHVIDLGAAETKKFYRVEITKP